MKTVLLTASMLALTLASASAEIVSPRNDHGQIVKVRPAATYTYAAPLAAPRLADMPISSRYIYGDAYDMPTARSIYRSEHGISAPVRGGRTLRSVIVSPRAN